MAVVSRKALGLPLRRLAAMTAIAVFLAPSLIHAESLNLFYAVDNESILAWTSNISPKKEASHRKLMEMDENGDFVIRNGNVSLLLAYNTPDDERILADHSRDLKPRECAALNGMSFKVAFTF
jgi:hypothetical protein